MNLKQEKNKMKKLTLNYIAIGIILLANSVIYSQSDSGITYSPGDISIIYDTGLMKKASMKTDIAIMLPKLESIKNISKIRLMSDNLISVSNDNKSDVELNIHRINSITLKDGSNLGEGIVFGALIGLGLGLAAGAIVGNGQYSDSFSTGIATLGGGVIGLSFGALFGGIIGASSSNYKTYNINGNKYELEKVLAGNRNQK